MDPRLAGCLERIGEADRSLRDDGLDPEPFLLIYSGGGSKLIHHPRWDDSWVVPTAEDVDDLEELGFVRTEPGRNTKRLFSPTVRGREQAKVLKEQRSTEASVGPPPALNEVLSWLVQRSGSRPSDFAAPTRLLDAAIDDGFIDASSRGGFAGSLLQLAEEGFLTGDIPDFQQANAEHRLGLSSGLALTMKAHDRAAAASGAAVQSLQFYGPVVAGQIAAGDIHNYVSFGALLDRAENELADLDDVDDGARNEAQQIIETLRGKAVSGAVVVATGAGGALLANILGQLIGLPPS